MGDNYISPCD